jgi:UDP-glucose 4-epimerase
MKTLVTGGAGFIGSNLVRFLIEQGHDVTVLDNLHSGFMANIDSIHGIKFINGDIRDKEKVAIAVSDVEVIFHLAASVGNKRSIENPIDDSEINLIGTLQILEAARKAGVRKIVYSSSAGIFGELKMLPIVEDHPLEPDSPYGTSKLAAEKMCLAYSKLHGIDAICLRYFNVYGINQRYDAYGNAIPIFAYQLLNGQPITIYDDGEQTRDFVEVMDVVQANYKAALSENISGPFNIASGSRVTINNLVKSMGNIMNMKPKIQYAPPRKGDVKHSLADISSAQNLLGYSVSVGLEEGLKRYLNWAEKELVN